MLTLAFAVAVLGALCLTGVVAYATGGQATATLDTRPARVRVEQVFTERAPGQAVEEPFLPAQTRTEWVNEQQTRPFAEPSVSRAVPLEL